MIKNECTFWYDKNFTSFYINPVQIEMNLPFFRNAIIGAERIIPNDNDRLPIITPLLASRIHATPYRRIMERSYGTFLMRYAKDIRQYAFIMDNSTIIRSLESGIFIGNTNASLINNSLRKVIGKKIDIELLQAERFYQIKEGVIIPTNHITDDVTLYINEHKTEAM